jgi:YesN/AraC family two-component response regulator
MQPVSSQYSRQLAALKVLIVDDESTMRKVTRSLLQVLRGHGERSHVIEAESLGVNEFLLKHVSSTALLARLVSILANPREMVKKGDYYGPEPRKFASYKPENASALVQTVLI